MKKNYSTGSWMSKKKDGIFHHYTVTFDGRKRKEYIDGILTSIWW